MALFFLDLQFVDNTGMRRSLRLMCASIPSGGPRTPISVRREQIRIRREKSEFYAITALCGFLTGFVTGFFPVFGQNVFSYEAREEKTFPTPARQPQPVDIPVSAISWERGTASEPLELILA